MTDPDWKIYSKQGDTGQTQLLSGETVEKDHARVKAYGCLDELQSHLGMARSLVAQEPMRAILGAIQQDLFVAASELASTSQSLAQLHRRIEPQDTARLENQIDAITAHYGLPSHFVVPGTTVESSALHVARSVCRRCERLIAGLNRQVQDYPQLLPYFNRLSDLLFVLAWANEVKSAVEEVVLSLFCSKSQEAAAASTAGDSAHITTGGTSAREEGMKISYPLAQRLTLIAEERAVALGVPMVIALTDAAGSLLCFGRMDGALPASTELAVSKAFTAAILRTATHELSRLAQPGGTLYGIQHSHQGRIVLLGGGLPLRLQDQVVGAVGISGGTVEQDIQVAQGVVEALEEMAGWAESIGKAVPLDPALEMSSLYRLETRLRDELKMMDASLPENALAILTGAVLLASSVNGTIRRNRLPMTEAGL